MKNRFDLIIFDWDGTLINSIDWIAGCIQRSAERCGFATPDYQATKNVIGLSIERAMQTLLPEADENTQNQLVANYAEEYFSKQLSREDFFSWRLRYVDAVATYRLSVSGSDRQNKRWFGAGLACDKYQRLVLCNSLC